MEEVSRAECVDPFLQNNVNDNISKKKKEKK
jgi:hypothetical protein